MIIELENIIPNVLNHKLYQRSDIWKKKILFTSNELIHIVAPSGKGKSTLMGILYGTRKDFKGSILFNNKRLGSPKDWSELRTNQLAIVFQDLELLDDLTVLENIQLKNQLTSHFSDVTILEMLTRLNLEELKNQQVGFLSRGEKQRVAIIRSLCMPFTWLLLDEPFSALDGENIKNALALIKEQVEKNNSGVIIANLQEDDWFNYTRKLKMV
ncbi:MAG: ABC transporter [Flavobacteriales bacterium]|nr:ABC transporter [Flavobacteriales bacterium]|tara:strand:+ start:564 stop:1202 length:639 start_codon:yes stop_codon:yes gene_type:complete